MALREKKIFALSKSRDIRARVADSWYSLVKVDEREDHLSWCRTTPVQTVALAHHQDGLVLLRKGTLAVDPPQHQRSVRIFISADG